MQIWVLRSVRPGGSARRWMHVCLQGSCIKRRMQNQYLRMLRLRNVRIQLVFFISPRITSAFTAVSLFITAQIPLNTEIISHTNGLQCRRWTKYVAALCHRISRSYSHIKPTLIRLCMHGLNLNTPTLATTDNRSPRLCVRLRSPTGGTFTWRSTTSWWVGTACP